jgi:Flp pilus assembly protein TadG
VRADLTGPLDLTDRSSAPARRLGDDRGSALLLMPAAVLVLLILGAIAADLSHLHNRKRELIAVADSIANDAATYGIDIGQLRGPRDDNAPTGPLRFDPKRLDEVGRRSVAAHGEPDRPVDVVSVEDTVDPATGTVTVTVKVQERVDYIFARAIPGLPDHEDITATGRASAEED